MYPLFLGEPLFAKVTDQGSRNVRQPPLVVIFHAVVGPHKKAVEGEGPPRPIGFPGLKLNQLFREEVQDVTQPSRPPGISKRLV
jgi:hypothetical protein